MNFVNVTRYITISSHKYERLLKSFLPLVPVFLCGVAGLAQTFPSFPVSGPFLPDAPRRHVPPDRILPPQLWSSSKALPLDLHFCFISSFNVPEPFQPSPSHT